MCRLSNGETARKVVNHICWRVDAGPLRPLQTSTAGRCSATSTEMNALQQRYLLLGLTMFYQSLVEVPKNFASGEKLLPSCTIVWL